MLSLVSRLLQRKGTLTWNEVADRASLAQEIPSRFRFIYEWIRQDLDGLVVDVGCWSGNFAQAISAFTPFRYLGLDIAEAMLALKYGKDRTPFADFCITPSALRLPLRSNTAALVVFSDVIEHLPRGEEPAALKEIYRVLQPSGALIMSTNLLSWLSPLDPAWLFGHRHYTQVKLNDMLIKAGFRDLEFRFVRGFWAAIDCNLMYFNKHVLGKGYARTPLIQTRTAREYDFANKRGSSSTEIWCKCRKSILSREED